MDTSLTVRVPKHVLENARCYAKAHQTTLSELITAYLQRIPTETDVLAQAPIVRRLTGMLLPDAAVEDINKHSEEKYGYR